MVQPGNKSANRLDPILYKCLLRMMMVCWNEVMRTTLSPGSETPKDRYLPYTNLILITSCAALDDVCGVHKTIRFLSGLSLRDDLLMLK